jgi:hypothetical protein
MFKETTATTPDEYLEALDEPRRSDMRAVDALIRATAPDLEPHLQSGMLAYGRYPYRTKSGSSGEWFPIGLASNKRYISLYVMAADGERYLAETFRVRLPKADIGKSCVRFKRLADLDRDALVELIRTGATFHGQADWSAATS